MKIQGNMLLVFHSLFDKYSEKMSSLPSLVAALCKPF